MERYMWPIATNVQQWHGLLKYSDIAIGFTVEQPDGQYIGFVLLF